MTLTPPSLLAPLLKCHTRDELRTAWLSLPDYQRAVLRPNKELAAHAWSVLKATPDAA